MTHRVDVERFVELFQKWNGSINLSAATKRGEVLEHVEDCLHVIPHLDGRSRVLDVGSGGGFPVVLAAMSLPARGVNPWRLSTFVLATIFMEFYRGTRARQALMGETPVRALSNLVGTNRRRYGGYVIHVGGVSRSVSHTTCTASASVHGSLAAQVRSQAPAAIGTWIPAASITDDSCGDMSRPGMAASKPSTACRASRSTRRARLQRRGGLAAAITGACSMTTP